VISRLGGYSDGLILWCLMCGGGRVGELAVTWIFSVECLDIPYICIVNQYALLRCADCKRSVWMFSRCEISIDETFRADM
jgi:hypothetical protein